MSVKALLALDLLVTVLAVGAWVAAAAMTVARQQRLATMAVVFTALFLTATRVLLVVALARHGWPLAQEKAVLSLPLLVIPALAVVVFYRRRSAVPVIAAACGAVAGLLVAFVVGYPATLFNSLIVVAMTVSVFLLIAGRLRRTSIAVLAAAVLLGPGLAFFGSPAHSMHGATNVSQIRMTADAAPVKTFELTASRLASGAWGFNGQVPGPELRVTKGDVVEVLLRNNDIDEGVTIHWHGYPVPNGDDGVAGVTQDAVMPGAEFRYRFRADKAGTFWYHTHQLSHRAVKMGLFGTLIVEERPVAGLDLTVVQHKLVTAKSEHAVAPGTPVRLRLLNADDVSHRFAVTGTQWRLSAVDGTDLAGPELVSDRALRLAAGGRYDVDFTMPDNPVALTVNGQPRLSPSGHASPAPAMKDLDLFAYGTPREALPTTFDRRHTVVLDRQLRVLNRLPAYAYTINGRVWPEAPPLLVREGELVKLTVVNRDKEAHPMHPHGHQVLVLSRNGVRASGSPLWMDSFDVLTGETWEVALRADNPGIWMSHCHNLPHAAKGMMLHLQYEGLVTTFDHGGHNHPE